MDPNTFITTTQAVAYGIGTGLPDLAFNAALPKQPPLPTGIAKLDGSGIELLDRHLQNETEHRRKAGADCGDRYHLDGLIGDQRSQDLSESRQPRGIAPNRCPDPLCGGTSGAVQASALGILVASLPPCIVLGVRISGGNSRDDIQNLRRKLVSGLVVCEPNHPPADLSAPEHLRSFDNCEQQLGVQAGSSDPPQDSANVGRRRSKRHA